MRKTAGTSRLPKIVVGRTEHHRLLDLATAIADRAPEVADELMAEMERARVVADDAIPPDVVRMGSTVEFTADTAPRRRVTLVYPANADISAGKVSVLTPIGAALIGLSAGQSIEWTTRDGRKQRLTVHAVERPKIPGI
jgi:regulator of nucleoside diphosphate kinase